MDKEFAIDGNEALEEAIAAAANGENLVLTRNGRPVAKVIAQAGRDIERIRSAAASIRAMPKIDAGGLTIKELVGQGRRY